MVKILFVGRLDTPKNPLMLLRVAEKTLKAHPDVLFTLVGDGEFYGDCHDFITSHNLSDNVQLVGWQNNVQQFYASHDIFIMTSIYEAFGLIFLEAGYNKLPTVATNVEGIPEVIENGVTGLLSDANNEEMMVANLTKLIEDADLRIKMGENAYRNVTTKFSADRMAEQYRQLYLIQK